MLFMIEVLRLRSGASWAGSILGWMHSPANKLEWSCNQQMLKIVSLTKFFTMDVKDSNGNILKDGDSVTVIKDLKVKGSSDVIKRGTKVNNIRLTDDPAEIDCRVNKTAMVLRTEFVKKV